eukprot:XP_011669622.1 PREDICTED: uncharacterized protein F54H12.2-like [Strongylocentrotus purpuratus]
MESEDQVYITLPSNSSMDYFPNNTLTSFTTKLATPLVLRGEYEVALVDIIYPHSWYNVNFTNNKYSFSIGDQVISVGRIPEGHYRDAQGICMAFNESLPANLRNKACFNVNPATYKVRATIQPNSGVYLSEGLGQLFGFPEGTLYSDEEARFLPDINGGLYALYAYTDIIENQRVGDISAPLLRIVSVDHQRAGEVIERSYQLPHYLPVKNCIIMEHVGGGGLPIFRGARMQRGYGLGSMLRGLLRSAIPIVKSGAKLVGKKALQTGLNVIRDVANGETISSAATSNLKKLGQQLASKTTGSTEEYTDLSQSLIHVQAKVVNGDGTPLDQEAQVGPTNMFLHTLFSDVDLMLNDRLVTPSTNTYAYRAALETLLTYGPEAKESQLTSALFYKDTPGHMDDGNPLRAGDGNQGLRERHRFIKESNTVDMVGLLHLDMVFQDRLLLGGVDIKLKLNRSKNSFSLMSSVENANYKVLITSASLHVRRVKLSPEAALLHAKTLETQTAKYPIRRSEVKTFSIPRGNLSFTRESLILGQLPKRLVIGCVSNTAFNGDFSKNPFNFHHYDLNFLALYADSEQIPWKPIRPNFSGPDPNFILAYQTLYSGINSMFHDKGNQITRTDYDKGYTLYAFDMTPDLSTGDCFNLRKHGNVRLEMQFARALPETVNVMVYAEYESVIEIDRNRNVIVDFGG